MGFDYEQETKRHYQDDAVAADYHDAFARQRGWRAWRYRAVAARERARVGAFLVRVPHGTVLDLPTGSGKLAGLMRSAGASVVACDISPNMLALARSEYAAAGVTTVRFAECDAERISTTLNERFDVAVCLRLLHRVPAEVRRPILRELAAVAGHAIVSFGVETGFHALRRRLRGRIFGGGTERLCYAPLSEILAEASEHFDVVDRGWILPWLSQEMVFLLRPKRRG